MCVCSQFLVLLVSFYRVFVLNWCVVLSILYMFFILARFFVFFFG